MLYRTCILINPLINNSYNEMHTVYTYQANHEWPCYNYYVSLCSHSNNTSSMNPTSKCHACSQGYKYKWLMPYSQGVEC